MPRPKTFDETEVLDKAVALFWKQGYHSTSMQDLVDALGINRASLYDTYGDKRSLFDKALERYRISNQKGMEEFFDDRTSVKQGLKELFEVAIGKNDGASTEKGCFVVNTTTELLPGDPEILKALSENKIAIERIFENYLSKGVQNGEISKTLDTKAFASLLFTQYNGIKVLSKISRNRQELSDSVSLMLGILDG